MTLPIWHENYRGPGSDIQNDPRSLEEWDESRVVSAPICDPAALEQLTRQLEREAFASGAALYRRTFAYRMAQQATLQVWDWEAETGQPAPEHLTDKAAFWTKRAKERARKHA